MGDLQCPATAVLLDARVGTPAWIVRLRIAGRFDLRSKPTAGVGTLIGDIGDIADQYRGETFLVLAGPGLLIPVLRDRGLPEVLPAVIEIDADGWRSIDPP